MASVEWNKKEELVADQALKHLKVILLLFFSVFTAFLPHVRYDIKCHAWYSIDCKCLKNSYPVNHN